MKIFVFLCSFNCMSYKRCVCDSYRYEYSYKCCVVELSISIVINSVVCMGAVHIDIVINSVVCVWELSILTNTAKNVVILQQINKKPLSM